MKRDSVADVAALAQTIGHDEQPRIFYRRSPKILLIRLHVTALLQTLILYQLMRSIWKVQT